jgi:hypothetical protein
MPAATKRKSITRRGPNVITQNQRAERARLRAQIRHNRDMRVLARRLKDTLTHTDLALKGFVRDVAPALGLTVIDRVEWERAVTQHRNANDLLEAAQRQVAELREMREAEAGVS